MEFVVSRDPLLRFHDLLPSLFHKSLPCPVEGRETTYHYWARNALFHGLKFLGLTAGKKVLVPAFHCRTVVEPVIQFGCEVVFYNIHRDGTVDFQDLEDKIDQHTQALIAIHYFGVLQPVRQLRNFCEQHGLLFIEDCAHILCGEIDGAPIGSFGDVSIFSWRKFFPMNDGGLLVRNSTSSHVPVDWKRLDAWRQVKIIKNLFENALQDRKRQETPVSKRISTNPSIQKTSRENEVNEGGQTRGQNQAADFDYSQVDWPMSQSSKSILRNMDFPAIVQKRKDNSRNLLNAMRDVSEVESWGASEEKDLCTWAFPILIPTRCDVHIKLREKGIQAFSWDGVIHPTLPLEKFPEAKFLYDHLVLLPNQQSLTREELRLVMSDLKDVLSDGISFPQAVC